MKTPNSHPPINTLGRFRSRIGAAALLAALACAPLAHASTYTWNAVSGNWSTSANWNLNSPVGGPLAGDTAVFNNTDTSASSNTVNNTVDLGFAGTIANLQYTNASTSPTFQVTQIPTGETLTVTNSVLVGNANQGTAYITYAYMTGGGTFKETGPNLTIQNYGNASGANATAYFNLLGLSNFIYYNTNGTISIGNNPGSLTRLGGNFILAGVSNNITATNIDIGTSTSAQAGPLCTLAFGTGTNIINTGAINIANQKNSANVTFADVAAGGLRFRGIGGLTSRGNIILGNRNIGNGTGTCLGQMILTGHPVDILGGTVIIGEVPVTAAPLSGSNGGQFGTGFLAFDSGVMDVTNLIMALNTAPNGNGGLSGAYATLIVGPNAVLRNSGGLTLVDQTASNVCSSTIIVSNGVLACNGSITAVTNIVDGTGLAASTNSIIFTNGGSILMGTGASIGTPANPIGTLAIAPATTIAFGAPPINGQPAIAVNALVWPSVDTGVAFVISNLPPTANVGTTIPILQYGTLTGGTLTAPQVILPSGVTGTVSTSGNTLSVTINSSIYPSFTAFTNGYITLSTNTAITTTAISTASTIANVTVVTTTTTLGGLTNTITTNTLSSPALTVTGLNTGTAHISLATTTNTIYLAVTATITDANGHSVSLAGQPFDTIVPSLVIEASDFNFSSGQFIDTPANGGLAVYTNQVGTPSIDESKATRAAPKSYYRPADAVIMQNANPQFGTPPTGTEQKFITALANGDTNDVEQEVGFNTPGDWLNYSRSFGSNITNSAPAGTYNVWCYLATSGTGPQGGFYQVTSDPTQGSQTTNFIGNFGSATFSDNGYNNFVYAPLVDQYGNRIPLSITNGIQTFRNVVVGNPNIAYYLFVPVAPILTPTVLHVSPDGSTPFQFANSFTFTVGAENGALISTNGIGLTINGTSVTGLTFTAQGNNWIVNYSIPSNGVYTAVISVTNESDLYTVSAPISFDTFSINDYQWEGVDYDYSTNNGTTWVGGQFIDNPVPTGDTLDIYSPPQVGTTATNSYYAYPTGFNPFVDPLGFGAVAQQGIDYFTNTQANVQTFYRADDVGSQQCGDWVRPKFYLAQTNFNDPNICPFNIGYFNSGNWMNYTRTYPTNTFYVWGRMACGNASFSGTTLSTVTSGVGTPTQTTSVLGSFSDSAPAGWQTYHWIPMVDGNGNKVVVSLGGQSTLRLTSGGAVDVEFLLLAPAIVPANFSVSALQSGNNIQLNIPTQNGHTYTVYYSPVLPATSWTQVGSVINGNGSVQPATQPLTGSQGFYRVLAQ